MAYITADIFDFSGDFSSVPRQGWKIHVSASKKNYKHIYDIVSNYCSDRDIAFKWIRDKKDFLNNISEVTQLSSLGKYITIYPKNQVETDRILSDMYVLLNNFKGPQIVDSFPYKNSQNLFFRYGINKVSEANADNFIMYGPNFEEVEDIARVTPFLPDWISLPEKWVQVIDSTLLTDFTPFEILKKSSVGNTYLATAEDDQLVIVKEAKKYTLRSGKVDTVELRENEWRLSNLFSFFPKPIKKIEEKYAYYYVYEHISGINLVELNSQKSFFIMSKKSKQNFFYIRDILLKIAKIVDIIHQNNYFNIDIQPENFLITENEIFLIDIETLNIQEVEPRVFGFWIEEMKGLSFKKKDEIRFYLLILFFFGKQNYILNRTSMEHVQSISKLALNLFCDSDKVDDFFNLDIFTSPLFDVIDKFSNIEFIGLKVEEVKVNPPKFTFQDMLRDKGYTNAAIDINIIGLSGISGVLMNLNLDNETELVKYYELIGLLEERLFEMSGNTYMYADSNFDYVDPYILNGMAGVAMAILKHPRIFHPKWLRSIVKTLAVPFCKSFSYEKGLLGLADTVLTYSYIYDDSALFSRGMLMLNNMQLIGTLDYKLDTFSEDNKLIYMSNEEVLACLEEKWL